MSFNLSKRKFVLPYTQFLFKPYIGYLAEISVIIFLVAATIVINWKMIRDGLNGMTDLRWHLGWIQHFSKQLTEGIWYPRWLAGTNYGYGSPSFVFYPPLVYYIGSFLKFLGLNIEQTVTALFSLALLGGGISFYIYGRDRWGRLAALTGALFYMLAPYITFNFYIRAALPETWALVWIPLILWMTDRAISRPKWRGVLAVAFAILSLTHVPSLLLVTIFWFPYTLFYLRSKSFIDVAFTVASVFLGWGLASLYLLPAVLEKSLVNIESMKTVSRGFESNLFGTPLKRGVGFHLIEPMSHQTFKSLIPLVSVAFFCHRQNTKKLKEIAYWIAFLFFLLFLMSYNSVAIWRTFTTLQMVQFPWRLLGLFSFGVAAVSGLAVNGIFNRSSMRHKILLLVIIGVLLGNFNYSYRTSRAWPTLHNPGRGTVANYETILTAINEPYADKLIDVPEYLPLLKNGNPPPAPIIGQPKFSVVSGEAKITPLQWESYNRLLQVEAEKTSTIRVRTYYYPAWHLYVNNLLHPIDLAEDGAIAFTVEPGVYQVQLRYQWTPVFTVGVILSILSIIALILYWLKTPV